MKKLFSVGTDTHEIHQDHENGIHVRVDDRDDGTVPGVWQVAVDIYMTDDSIWIEAPIAGVDPATIDLSLSRNILTISGTRNSSPESRDAKQFLVEECFHGPFSRSIILPENLAFNAINAKFIFNVLNIEIPKLKFESRTIAIH